MDAKQKKLQDFDDACVAYEKTFNKPSLIWLVSDMELEEITALMRRCIEEGRPYVYIPPGASELEKRFIYMRMAYEEALGEEYLTSPVSSMSTEEEIALMQRCIEEGKPYDDGWREGDGSLI